MTEHSHSYAMNRSIVIALAIGTLSGCANHYAGVTEPYGFFSGFWHGLIFEFSLIGYLLFDSVYIIGEPNTGLFYYIGFVLGLFKVGFAAR